MRAIVVLLMLVAAWPAVASTTITCETVRYYHAQLGMDGLVALGERLRVTPAQRRAAMRCLRTARKEPTNKKRDE